MKRKFLGVMAVVLAGALMLTACATSKEKDAQGGAPAGAGSAGQTQTPTQTEAPAQNVSGTTVDGGDAAGSGTADGGAGNAVQGEPSGSDGQGAPGTAEDPSQDAAQSSDIWSGTYVGAEETVTLAKLDDESVSFAFAQSGIAGTAKVSGSQAVYKGDDHHVIVFNVNDTVLDVSVSSEEDFDASESPLIGTYVREG